MTADIPKVVWTGAAERNMLRIIYLLNIYFVKSRIAVIFYTKYSGAKKVVVFNQFNKTNRMNFFSTTDHFISSMGINVF